MGFASDDEEASGSPSSRVQMSVSGYARLPRQNVLGVFEHARVFPPSCLLIAILRTVKISLQVTLLLAG
jgi:hypothetical protein